MEEFFEYFQIPKIEYKEPGRCVDDAGEICEWYISYDYPSIEPVFFDLLNYYNTLLNGTPLMVDNITEYKLCKALADAILERVKELEDFAANFNNRLEKAIEKFNNKVHFHIIE